MLLFFFSSVVYVLVNLVYIYLAVLDGRTFPHVLEVTLPNGVDARSCDYSLLTCKDELHGGVVTLTVIQYFCVTPITENSQSTEYSDRQMDISRTI